MQTKTATNALIARMLSFDGNFDGYPSMTCDDENIVFAAAAENAKDTRPDDIANNTDGVVLMSYLASEYVKTREQFDNARAFIQAFVDSCWVANMCEGSNPVFDELIEAGEEG